MGWRGIACTVVEQGDGTIATPKMNEVNTRTMEFCRRWGIANEVLNCPFPGDYPLDAVFVTSLFGEGRSTLDLFGNGFVLMRFPGALVAAIDRADIAELYGRRLVLVRPDGHVAWRADNLPEDFGVLVDHVRGGGPAH